MNPQCFLVAVLCAVLDGLIDRETFAAEKVKLMSQKMTLEEQKARLAAGRAGWLEPCPRQQKSLSSCLKTWSLLVE
jgi:hypothetical protein